MKQTQYSVEFYSARQGAFLTLRKMANMSSEETSVGFTVSKDDGSGFGAISRGVEELTSSAQKQVGMAKSNNQSTLKLKYNMAFQLEAEIEGDWEVVKGFTLSTIGLVLKAQVSDNEDGIGMSI